MDFPEPFRTVELLDWKSRPEDFERLCEFILDLFAERDQVSREQLFSILQETHFRREIRNSAESCAGRSRSLVICIYLRMKLLVLPEALRHEGEEE